MRDGDTLHDFPRHCQTKWGVWKQRVKGPRCSRRLAKRSVNKHLPKKKKTPLVVELQLPLVTGSLPTYFRVSPRYMHYFNDRPQLFFSPATTRRTTPATATTTTMMTAPNFAENAKDNIAAALGYFVFFFFVIFLSFSWLILSG